MAKSFRSLQVGNVVDIEFKGSSALGNEGHVSTRQNVTKVTDDAVEFDNDYEIYFFNKRWRYGSSAEVAKLLQVH